MTQQDSTLASNFRAAVDSALALLHDYADRNGAEQKATTTALTQPLPSLFEQCQQLLAEAQIHEPPPVRTIHQLACTGGALIARCIAAQPNTNVLSEVDPLSPFVPGGFLPTDLIGLSRFSSRPSDQDTQIQLFLGGLRVLYDQASRNGTHLILREHSHGAFHFGDTLPARPGLRAIVGRAFPVTSLVSVRHPFDAYLSLQETGWVQHFIPPTLDEYARRWHAFLDTHKGCEQIRYEDFVADPHATMNAICEHLGLGFNPDFPDTFSVIDLSGDAGRRGNVISPRPRRPHPASLRQEARDSESFTTLLSRLGYE